VIQTSEIEFVPHREHKQQYVGFAYLNTAELHLSGRWLSGSAWPFRRTFPYSNYTALEYANRRVQVKQDGLKLNGHISFWIMPMMLIYWEKVYIL